MTSHSRFLRFVIFLVCSIGSANAQTDSTLHRSARDTVRIATPDSAASDSLRIRFIPGMGNLLPVDSSNTLHSSQFLWTDSRYLGELLDHTAGFFLRDLGEPGKAQQPTVFGSDWRGIGVLLDGRPLNDPITGGYNLYDFPYEFVDGIEIISGGLSRLASSGASAATLNFVSKQYNTIRPQTKIRFVQDPYENILTDGLFAQNVARSTNLMFGFQRHVTKGRFRNAQLDSWNVRTRLRYNVSDRLNVSLMYLYTKTTNGLNGGIDLQRTTSIFEPVTAIEQGFDTSETIARHDWTLSAVAKLLPDSASTTQLTLYSTTNEREYDDPPEFFGQTGIADVQASGFSGFRIQQNFLEDFAEIQVGMQVEQRQNKETRTIVPHTETLTSFFGKAEIRALDYFVPTLFVRQDRFRGESALTSGVEASLNLPGSLSLFGEVSSSVRFPTIQELYWTDSTMTRPNPVTKESHTFVQAGLRASLEWLQLSVSVWDRTVKDAIVFRSRTTLFGTPGLNVANISEARTRGVTGSGILRVGHFEIQGGLNATEYKESDTVKTLIPPMILTSELSYRNVFFNSALDAKFGIRTRFYDRHRGMAFNSQMSVFFENKGAEVGRSTAIDLYGILKLGDAYVSLSWENIANAAYFVTPVYPMPGRYIRLSVRWAFLD